MAIQEAAPDRLGPYRLLDRIGEGGMGVVHLATDSENRLVAVKVLRPQIASDEIARRRLAREVETMRRVRSRFVAEVVDADVTGPVPYIVTRYVRGRTLEQVIGEFGPLRGAALQRLACGLASALTAVHAAGVVHRDLKPGNVMMVDGDPVVIDFGIAQAGDTTRLTQTGMFVGTPGYLAPEVIEGKPSDQSSDVHSWGATVAFAATGGPPYGTGTYEAVFFRILHGSANLDGVPPPLYPLVAAALDRDAARRPSAQWLAGQAAVLDLAAGPASWPAGGPPTRQAQGGPAAGHPPANGAARAYETPAQVADLLPPVRYPPPGAGRVQPGAGPGPAQPAGSPPTPGPASAPRRHRMLAFAALVMAVGIAVILPVAGTVAVLGVIALLRAGDRAQSGLEVRRSVRGRRATDALVVALSAPWTLARSVLVTMLVLPLSLLVAGAVAVAGVIVMRGTQLQLIGAYVAGLFVAVSWLGAGSRAARRQLNRVFNAIAPTRLAALATTIVLGSLAAALVSLAMIKAPVYWPVPDPHALLAHLPGAGLFHGTVAKLRHVGHGLAGRPHIP
jgi:protein kinase-like protein